MDPVPMPLVRDFKEKYGKEIFYILLISFLFHILGAIFSEGFHRPDEHLGIMRFVGAKLGLLSFEQSFSSWEYPARIRPWLQPYLYYVLIWPAKQMGLSNPFHLTMIMRLFSSLLAFGANLYFFNAVQSYLESKKAKIAFALSLFLLWFIPFFHARTSAENLGASFFLLGLALFCSKINSLSQKTAFRGNNRDILVIGAFWGTSFILRYQMIAMLLPVLLWIFLKVESKGKLLLLGVFSFLLVQLAAIPIDYLGYGDWTFVPWNYFYENIINGKASQFGTDPFWYYITKGLGRGIPPVSFLIIIASIWMFIKRPLNLISLSGLSFLIVHSLISHKEIRFIFPMIPLVAFYIASFIERLDEKFLPSWAWKLVLVVNLIVLVPATLRPAHNPIGFYKFLYTTSDTPNRIFTLNVVRDQLNFYQRKSIELIHIKDLSELNNNKSWVLTDRLNKRLSLESKNCKVLYSSYPEWIVGLLKKYKKNKRMWSLLTCGAS